MNVKIIRVLNTNAVVSVDSQGMELIMTGPGIGFKKRKGENIDQSLVDKTYHLENKEETTGSSKRDFGRIPWNCGSCSKRGKKRKIRNKRFLICDTDGSYQFSSRSLSRRNRIKEYDENRYS